MMRQSTIVLLLLAICATAFADLTDIRAERNPEKRADRAIDHATGIAHNLKKTYENESWDATNKVLNEVAEAMELAWASLTEAGKNARRNPKHYKSAEVKSRDVLRRLEAMHSDVSVDDREPVDKARARVQKVHDDLLQAIMAK